MTLGIAAFSIKTFSITTTNAVFCFAEHRLFWVSYYGVVMLSIVVPFDHLGMSHPRVEISSPDLKCYTKLNISVRDKHLHIRPERHWRRWKKSFVVDTWLRQVLWEAGNVQVGTLYCFATGPSIWYLKKIETSRFCSLVCCLFVRLSVCM